MKKINFSRLLVRTRQLVCDSPVEVLTCLVTYMFVAFLPQDEAVRVLLMPFVFGIAYTVNNLTRKSSSRKRWIYYACVLLIGLALVASEIFLYCLPNGKIEVWFAGGIACIMAFFLLVPMMMFVTEPGCEDEDVAGNFFNLMLSILICFVIGLALTAVVFLILVSADYIFGLNLTENIGKYLLLFVWIVIVPCAFLMSMSSLRGTHLRHTRFLDVMVNHIVGSAAIIYTGILYVYLLKIAITATLPLGNLTAMIAAFFIVAFMWLLMHNYEENCHYRWYSRYFGYIALPLIALFAVGLGYRILQYGFTLERVYMAYVGLLMLITSAVLIFMRRRRFKTILYATVALILLSTYVPYISAREIGIYSQRARLEKLARQVGAYEQLTGRIKWKQSPTAEEADIYREMESIHRYLAQTSSDEEVRKMFGEKTEVDYSASKQFESWTCTQDVPVREYTLWVPEYRTRVESENNCVVVYVDDKEVLCEELRVPEAGQTQADTLPVKCFVYTNSKYMVVLPHLYRDGEYVTCSTYGYTILKKPGVKQ